MTDRDLANLLHDLDQGVWLTLAAIADWHEQHGEAALALAYRWIVQRRRYPRHDPRLTTECWQWYKLDPGSISGVCWHITPEVMIHLESLEKYNSGLANYPTKREAYADLARAYTMSLGGAR